MQNMDFMENNRAKALISKYLAGNCTPEEKVIVESWYEKNLSNREDELAEPDYDNIEEEIWNKLQQQKARPAVRTWPRIAAAASVLIFLSVGAYFFWYHQPPLQTATIPKRYIAPGGNKAILTLTNGQQIILTGAKNGILANQGSVKVSKTGDGEVVYDGAESASGKVIYNTMTTPRGGQYHLTLADGTEVWLNAASSIKYPVAFIEQTREVEVTGEAYFEVVHDASKPFIVKLKGQHIQVLGTHFNVNAYDDESVIKTTLLEGSIKVTRTDNGTVKLLDPGQQSLLAPNGLSVLKANVEETVAWKNGYFRFNNEKIRSIMLKLSRWYDIDVEYEGPASDEGYYGTISRYKNIGDVLKMLEQTKGVHFKIEGRKVTVIR